MLPEQLTNPELPETCVVGNLGDLDAYIASGMALLDYEERLAQTQTMLDELHPEIRRGDAPCPTR